MTETQEAMKKLRMDLPDDLEVTVTLTIRLHRNGAMSIEGPTGDVAFCKQLLDETWDAIKRNQRPVPLIVPGCDVEAKAKESYL